MIEVTTINIIKETLIIISFAIKIVLYFIFAFHNSNSTKIRILLYIIMDAYIKEIVSNIVI